MCDHSVINPHQETTVVFLSIVINKICLVPNNNNNNNNNSNNESYTIFVYYVKERFQCLLCRDNSVYIMYRR